MYRCYHGTNQQLNNSTNQQIKQLKNKQPHEKRKYFSVKFNDNKNIIANVKYINQRIETNQEDQIKELIDVTKFYKSIHANILGISDPLSKEERIIFSNWMDDVFNNKEMIKHIITMKNKTSSQINQNDMIPFKQLHQCNISKDVIQNKLYKTKIPSILKKLDFDINIFNDYKLLKQHQEKLHVLMVPHFKKIIPMTSFKKYKYEDELKKYNNPQYISVNDKITMIKIMTELNAQIEGSWTADAVNNNNYSQGQRFIALNIKYSSNHINDSIFDDILNENIYQRTPLSKDLTLFHLHNGYHTKKYVCSLFATYMAIKLRENFPYLKDQIHVCDILGHTMCCIGDLNNPDSIIIDPWIRYLNLQGHVKYSDEKNRTIYYRNTEVRHNAEYRTRGYFGTVKDYKQFLKDHPNDYVPKNKSLEMTINNTFNDVSRQITSAEIEAPKLPQNTIIALKQILKDNNIKIQPYKI